MQRNLESHCDLLPHRPVRALNSCRTAPADRPRSAFCPARSQAHDLTNVPSRLNITNCATEGRLRDGAISMQEHKADNHNIVSHLDCVAKREVHHRSGLSPHLFGTTKERAGETSADPEKGAVQTAIWILASKAQKILHHVGPTCRASLGRSASLGGVTFAAGCMERSAVRNALGLQLSH